MSSIKPRPDKSIDFLIRFHPDSPWTLTSISTDKKTVRTESFDRNRADAAQTWVEEQCKSERNVYFHVNPTKSGLKKKAEKSDVVSVNYFHVDLDPRAGEEFNEERARILRTLENAEPRPTVVVDSGGGYQAFWALSCPIEINGDVSLAESAERYNIQLERLYGADHCHNVDRLMRLPGTINNPDERKKKKGRSKALSSVIWFEETEYPVTRFTQAPKLQTEAVAGFCGNIVQVSSNVEFLDSVDDLNKWHVPDWLRVLIVQGKDPDDVSKFASRSEAVFAVACNLLRHEVPENVVFSVFMDPSFGISESVLEQKRPERYALRQITRAKEYVIDPLLLEYNEKHAVIADIGGKCRIISEVFDPTINRYRISKHTFEDFGHRYCNVKVQVGATEKGTPILKSAGQWWIAHPQRRQYESILFAPGREVPGCYNLWKGFAVDAVPGDKHLMFLDHVKKNICDGKEAEFRYLIGWMARTVQHPDCPGEVAVVLRGERGSGKSFFVKTFGELFGRHFLTVSDSRHLVGNFNAHLRDAVVVFGDEAFYAGDKRHESSLKTLITGDTLLIEGKGVDAEFVPNYIHLMMASNSDWVAPAGADERRFFCLDVANGNKQDKPYFRLLTETMKNGGSENLLHYLLSYDLSNYEVRDVLTTKALKEQKMLSLSPEERWWYGKLYNGGSSECGVDFGGDTLTSTLFEDYLSFMRSLGVQGSKRLCSPHLGRFLMKLVGEGMKTIQKKGLYPVRMPDGTVQMKEGRPYYYRLPTIQEARDSWDKTYGSLHEWPEPEQEVDKPEPF